MKKLLLAKLGQIVKPYHLKGEVKVLSFTSFSNVRYKKNNKVFLKCPENEELIEVTVKAFRSDGKFDYLVFDEISTIEDAEKYRNYLIVVDQETLPKLSEGTYYFSELLNLDTYLDNALIGKVIKVEEMSNKVYLRVKKENAKEILIPFLEPFILDVDINNKKIYLKEMKGLYD